jgi:hypothetical protein
MLLYISTLSTIKVIHDMKIASNSRWRHYVARLSIFLITAALIAVVAGCVGGVRLTITSTEGGSVTTPGEGTFTYDEGTVVDLVAEADAGYRFVDWTGYVPAIADVTAAVTNITMYRSYSITANFASDICLEIRDWYDLDAVRNNLCGSYILMNDLDSTTPGYTELASPTAHWGQGWEPIGAGEYPFRGIFNGGEYEIRDLFIFRPSEEGVGLFGSVGKAGAIKDIGVVNVTIMTGDGCVGGLVGYNSGTVSNSCSIGSVSGNFRVGGLVGRNFGTVNNSYSTGSVSGDSEVGGLVGGNEYKRVGMKDIEGTVSDSYSMGSVTGEDVVGGLVGLNYATVSDSYSTSSVTGEDHVGGLAGANQGTVNNSYYSGNVTGEEYVGGLVGSSTGTVSNSYSAGSVSGYENVGGLVGYNNGPVSNSFYNYDEDLINGENIITVGALFNGDFDQWLANDKFLDVNERLSQEGGYYMVNNITDFKELLAFGQNDTLKFRLKNDLDLAAEHGLYIPYLSGEFDGNGHEISNLSFDFDFVSHVGLFGYLARGGKVTRVGVENVNVTGASSVAGLVGRNRGTVGDSHSTGSVTGNEDVGGLVGSGGTVSNSYFIGSVSGNVNVGGLVGWGGAVSNCYATGSVTGEEFVGGLVGLNEGPVSNSYSLGNVSGGEFVGGLVGLTEWSTVSNCYAMGNVNGDSGVGGLAGGNDGTVSNCYSNGGVSGNEDVGGLVGWNDGTVSTSFWDTQTSGQASSDGGTGKTTTQMKSLTTFSGAGWNIISVVDANTRNPAYTWNIVDTQTYPFLSWQPVQ